MSEKRDRRARGAKVMQELRQRRAARMGRGRATKVEDGAFEQVKEKMVMRIYGVSSEKAKEIIAERTAEAAAREAENRAKREKRVTNFHRRAHADADDEWIPASEIFCGAKE